MDLGLVLAPILLADVLNPVLLALLIYALGAERPFALSVAALLGHTVAYFTAGIGVALGMEAIGQRLANPEPSDYVIELVVGLALLGIGIAMARGRKAPSSLDSRQEERTEASLLGAFSMGAIVNVVGIPFAVPYFGAVAQILKADLSAAGAVGAIGLYNLLYALPFALVIAARALFGESANAPLARLNDGLERASNVLIPVLLLGLGGLFVMDALRFLFGSGG
jgi:cytochrome c biogenesis protein CcdA